MWVSDDGLLIRADPYAFDLDSSFHLKASDEEDSEDASSKKKKKTKTKESKKKTKEPPLKKEVWRDVCTLDIHTALTNLILVQTKSVLSLEDRVAQILKRTGSTALPPPKATDERESKRSDDDEESDRDAVYIFAMANAHA